MHGGALLKFAERFEFGGELLDELKAFVDVGILAATEDHAEHHLVFLVQEFLGPIDLGREVGFADFGAEANFLILTVVRVAFMLPFFLLVLELTVVHDPADGRLFVRSDLDQIEPDVLSAVECLFGGDDTQLLSFFGNNANGGDADLIVDPLLLAFDS